MIALDGLPARGRASVLLRADMAIQPEMKEVATHGQQGTRGV